MTRDENDLPWVIEWAFIALSFVPNVLWWCFLAVIALAALRVLGLF